MTDPDAVVGAVGEEIELERVVDPVYDANDVLDRDASTIETELVQAVVSQPSENDTVREEGRVGTADAKATVASTVDVATQREGRRDRVIRYGYGEGSAGDTEFGDGTRFEVVDVQKDRHPFTGVEKQTLMLKQIDGRGP